MTKIIGVRFKPSGKMYYFDPLDYEIKRGMHVVVKTSRGVEYGEVTLGIKEVSESEVTKPLKGVLRIATDEDTAQHKANKEREREAFSVFNEKIKAHKLGMKLIEVEYAFDGSKILFYFTADGRVDFRELVKDLASVFRTRIELRQIGVRDESKTMGSIGMCGRNLCCSQFLGDFVPVSIKMAKEQGLSLNPTKISGACGRLMCCLKYEQETYEALAAEFPKPGAVIDTPSGRGTVVDIALLRNKIRVKLEEGDETTLKEFDLSELSGETPESASVLTETIPEPEAEHEKKRTRKRRSQRKPKQLAEGEEKQEIREKEQKSETAAGEKPVQNGGQEHKRRRRFVSHHGNRSKRSGSEGKQDKQG